MALEMLGLLERRSACLGLNLSAATQLNFNPKEKIFKDSKHLSKPLVTLRIAYIQRGFLVKKLIFKCMCLIVGPFCNVGVVGFYFLEVLIRIYLHFKLE